MSTQGLMCKCCRASTKFFATIDAARSCEDKPSHRAFSPSCEGISYEICSNCRFLFTRYFDEMTDEEIGTRIYNADYILADPDFLSVRPRYMAESLAPVLAQSAKGVKAVDFGGGSGLFARLMREQGFSDYASHDPYFGEPVIAAGAHDLVTAFEVVEHSRTPDTTLQEICAYLKPDGCALFTTQLQPDPLTVEWRYLAPRNGHVSLHSARSLAQLGLRLGVTIISLDNDSHMMFRGRPGPIARLVLEARAGAVLYTASRQGLGAYLRAARALVATARAPQVVSPRHIARALVVTARRSF